jgi:hypothetical protein
MKPWVKTWGFLYYTPLLFRHFYCYAPKLKVVLPDDL